MEVINPSQFQSRTALRRPNKVSFYAYKGIHFTLKGSILNRLERIPDANSLWLPSTTPPTTAPTATTSGAPTTIRGPVARMERGLLYRPANSGCDSLVHNSKNHKLPALYYYYMLKAPLIWSAHKTPPMQPLEPRNIFLTLLTFFSIIHMIYYRPEFHQRWSLLGPAIPFLSAFHANFFYIPNVSMIHHLTVIMISWMRRKESGNEGKREDCCTTR